VTISENPASADSPSSRILGATLDLRTQLLQHSIYDQISTVNWLKVFMQHHVFAVMDFMWLLKRLQHDLCCNTVPWLPPANSDLARFVNEIVLGEETDEDGRQGYCSHFEMYLQAMSDIGASTDQIQQFVQKLRAGAPVLDALQDVGAPESVRDFVEFNYRVAKESTAAEVAAVFCFGREDIIPDMFARLLKSFSASDMKVPRLAYYIQRHIELDGDHHGPLTHRMVNILCDSDQTTKQAMAKARAAIELRIRLWDGVLQEIHTVGNSPISTVAQ